MLTERDFPLYSAFATLIAEIDFPLVFDVVF